MLLELLWHRYKAKGKKAKYAAIDSPDTLQKTVKKLKAKKMYTFKVRTVTEVYNPTAGAAEKVYGQWSNARKIKARK